MAMSGKERVTVLSIVVSLFSFSIYVAGYYYFQRMMGDEVTLSYWVASFSSLFSELQPFDGPVMMGGVWSVREEGAVLIVYTMSALLAVASLAVALYGRLRYKALVPFLALGIFSLALLVSVVTNGLFIGLVRYV